jgi:hypothetical protein
MERKGKERKGKERKGKERKGGREGWEKVGLKDGREEGRNRKLNKTA